MTEEDQATKEELLIDNIREELRSKFNIEIEYIGDGKLGIEEFNGYIDSEEQFEIIEDLATEIINKLRNKYDSEFSYELLSEGYEIVLEII